MATIQMEEWAKEEAQQRKIRESNGAPRIIKLPKNDALELVWIELFDDGVIRIPKEYKEYIANSSITYEYRNKNCLTDKVAKKYDEYKGTDKGIVLIASNTAVYYHLTTIPLKEVQFY